MMATEGVRDNGIVTIEERHRDQYNRKLATAGR